MGKIYSHSQLNVQCAVCNVQLFFENNFISKSHFISVNDFYEIKWLLLFIAHCTLLIANCQSDTMGGNAFEPACEAEFFFCGGFNADVVNVCIHGVGNAFSHVFDIGL